MESGPVYALNLFNVTSKQEYLIYSRRSVEEVKRFGGKVVALGKFKENIKGSMTPRTVMILVEWESSESFHQYRSDPSLNDLHPHRENGTANYIWQLFDKLSDLRPILKQ